MKLNPTYSPDDINFIHDEAQIFVESILNHLDDNITPILGDDGKYHYVYLTINKINGFFYIGKKTVSDDLKKRQGVNARLKLALKHYLGSGIRIQQAISQYGENNFLRFVLKFFKSSEDAFEMEAQMVDEITLRKFAIDLKCMYNIITGGNGGFDPIERDKRSNQLYLKKNDELCLVNHEDVLLFLNNGYLPANAYVYLYNPNHKFKITKLRFSDGNWRLNWLINNLTDGWQIISKERYMELK